ncbi:MAG: DUF1289 domain-containing protein [Gammaproteobacteria bacterium]|nr:DUF1289 domain-containing protein [Gammaproteobacteria bacterium]
MQYTPCQNLCDKTANICPGCGRSREEIENIKEITQKAVDLGLRQGYSNIDEYADAIAAKIKKKLHQRHAIRQRLAQANS